MNSTMGFSFIIQYGVETVEIKIKARLNKLRNLNSIQFKFVFNSMEIIERHA